MGLWTPPRYLPRPPARRRQAEGDWLISPTLDIPHGVRRVGALVELAVGAPTDDGGSKAAPELVVEAQTFRSGTVLTTWLPVRVTFAEGRLRVFATTFPSAGDAARIRVRADQLDWLRKLQWTGAAPEVDPDTGEGLGVTAAPLTAALDGYGIVTRSAWKSRATKCSSVDKKRYRMAIHHTETYSDKPATRVRAIQAYHMDGRGWCDIGYHFLIGNDGEIYEGRPYALLGAHTGGNNSGNVGISFVGCFHDKGCAAMPPNVPPAAMLEAAAALMGTLAELEGIVLDGDHVRGHGQHEGAATACPGTFLRERVGLLISMAKTRTLANPKGGAAADAGTAAEADAGSTAADAAADADAAVDADADTDADPTQPTEPPKTSCESLPCGLCSPLAGCQWCASQGGCRDGAAQCTWNGLVGLDACWSALWPCAVASCWNPKKTLPACGSFAIDEDFSSGKFNVHRYWMTLPGGAPVTLRLQRKAGLWQPALVGSDHAAKSIVGGEVAQLHPNVEVLSATSGRFGSEASVRLLPKTDTKVLILVTAWATLDTGFVAKIPTNATYRFTLQQDCSGN